MRTILIIDDADEMLELAQIGLELGGTWSCLTARSSCEGLQAAARDHPDAILLDFSLPDANGLATLEKLRSDPVTAPIPVIFLTGCSQPAERQRFLDAGAAGVVVKPFDPMALAGQVDEILG